MPRQKTHRKSNSRSIRYSKQSKTMKTICRFSRNDGFDKPSKTSDQCSANHTQDMIDNCESYNLFWKY